MIFSNEARVDGIAHDTANLLHERVPVMTQTMKTNQWNFGMKAHFGEDAEEVLTDSLEHNMTRLAEITMMESCRHGEEAIAFSDGGHYKKNRTTADCEKKGNLSVLAPTEKQSDAPDRGNTRFNRVLLGLGTILERYLPRGEVPILLC